MDDMTVACGVISPELVWSHPVLSCSVLPLISPNSQSQSSGLPTKTSLLLPASPVISQHVNTLQSPLSEF